MGRAIWVAAMALGLAGALGAQTAQAQNVDLRGKSFTEQDIINALVPAKDDCNQPGVRCRGVRPTAAAAQGTDQLPAVTLDVPFKLNSAELTPDAAAKLAAVGNALKSQELSQYKFILEGHTDSTGSAQYNKTLSDRRARAVKDYLAATYNVPGNRVAAIGFGESKPIDPANPADPANRRVVVKNNLGK